MKRRILSFFTAFILLLGLLPGSAFAAEAPTSGTWGENGTWAFYEETGTLMVEGSGEIPDYPGYESGGVGVPWFHLKDKIQTISFSSGITRIGDNAFGGYYELSYYSNLTFINLPNSLESIGAFAFYGAPLTFLRLPDGITSIEDAAFGYTQLATVHIPASVTYLGDLEHEWFAFDSESIQSITVDSRNRDFEAEDGVLYNKGKTKLIYYPYGNTLTDYTIPDTIQGTLYLDSFYRRNALESITVPEEVNLEYRPGYGGTMEGLGNPVDLSQFVTLYFEGAVPDGIDDWRFVKYSNPNEEFPISTIIAVKAEKIENTAKTYSVSYNLNGGTGTIPTTSSYSAGDQIIVTFSTPVRENYVFSGWSDGTTIYQPGDTFTMPESNVTFTAVWEAMPSGIDTSDWTSYDGYFSDKYVNNREQAEEVYASFASQMDPDKAARVYDIIFNAQYRITAFGGDYFPYPNGHSTSRVIDNIIGTVSLDGPSAGCYAYTVFAQKYVNSAQGTKRQIDDSGTNWMEGALPTADELKLFIQNYASPGEHIRFNYIYSAYGHSVVYLTSDNNGLYFLSYSGSNYSSPIRLMYCSWTKLSSILKKDNSATRIISVYDTMNWTGQVINGGADCPIEMSITYNNETLSSTGLDGTAQSSFGTMTASGADQNRNITFSLEYHPDYEISITGTGDGYCDFYLEFIDSNQNTTYRKYLNIPVSASTHVKVSHTNVNDGITLYVDTDSDNSIDSGWHAEINETVELAESEVLVWMYGGEIELPDPTPDADDDNSGSSSSSSERRYDIDLDVGRGGDVSLSADRASAGTRITITVDPDAGYELDELTVLDEDGDALTLTQRTNSTYTFHMPTGPVTVEASFIRSQAETAGLPFADVASNTWYYDAVEYMYENGLMSGVSDGWFSPDAALTRAQLVQILYALEGRPAVSNSSGFTDVTSADWFADAVGWAAANGVVSGVSAGTFAPNDPLTREQLALILYRYAQYKSYDTTQGGMAVREFSDYSTISSWALEAMDWAVNAGLLSGTGNGMLSPAGTATRAQVAQILMNFCETVAR